MHMPASLPRMQWGVIVIIVLAKLALHIVANDGYGFHRDELLYLSLGKNPAWGYWSNPPMIGWISWLVQHIIGDSVAAIRAVSSLAGCAVVVLAGLMAREMGGGRIAQSLATLTVAASPGFLRGSALFQPVIFDILNWTLLCWILLRYLRTGHLQYVVWWGVFFGLGFLNKYMVVFMLPSLVPALILGGRRHVLWSLAALKAALWAALIIAPNIWWQYQHDWPVIAHMQGLSQNQLVNVQRLDFLSDQLVIHAFGFLIWIPGLYWLLRGRIHPFSAAGWLYVFVIAILLLLKGKSYYSVGLYPMLMAAGGMWWEQRFRTPWVATALGVVLAGTLIPILPFALPVLQPDKMVAFGKKWATKAHFDAPLRWEDGQAHPLPQDYADMLGWDELAQLADKAYAQAENPAHTMIYGENYGQAGAVLILGGKRLPRPQSFADSFLLWADPHTDANALIYINDELGEDVAALFEKIQLIGQIEHPYARERGTSVYLLERPRQPFAELWAARVQEEREGGRE